MARQKEYPGGFRLTKKTAAALAVREFGTAKGLEQEPGMPVGYYCMMIGNLEVRIHPDAGKSSFRSSCYGIIQMEIRMNGGPACITQFFDKDTLEQNFQVEEIELRARKREVLEDCVTANGPELCHKKISKQAERMEILLYQLKERFVGHLYRAMGKDWEQYENIYKDISENWEQYGGGAEDWTEDKFQEKITNAMESKMAKDLGLEKVSSLPIEYTPPGLDRSFDQEVRRQLEQGGNWMDTLPEGTAELAKEIEGLKPEKGQKSVSALQKIQEIRESIWGDDAKDLFLSDILSKNDYSRLQDAKKVRISIEKWCKLYEDISQEKVRRTGKPGSPSQDDVAAVLKRTSGLSEKQKDAVWAGYGWKSERSTEKNVSDSDTKLEGLALPELPRFGG